MEHEVRLGSVGRGFIVRWLVLRWGALRASSRIFYDTAPPVVIEAEDRRKAGH